MIIMSKIKAMITRVPMTMYLTISQKALFLTESWSLAKPSFELRSALAAFWRMQLAWTEVEELTPTIAEVLLFVTINRLLLAELIVEL